MPDFRSRITGKLNAASSSALAFRIDTDNQYRVEIEAGGRILWGPGGSTNTDTNLYRSAADTLKTDDVFQAASGIITVTTAGAPSASLADGAIAVDTTNNAFYFRSGSQWRQVTGGGGSTASTQTFTISGTLLQGVGQARWYAPRALTISNVQASVATVSAGQSIIFDVNVDGVTIFSTQGNRPTIAAGANTDLSSTPNTTSVAQGSYITVDVDQVGTTTAGADAVIQIEFS